MVHPIGATGTAEAAVRSQAVRASGVIVRIEPDGFQQLIDGQPEPMVVMASSGWLTSSYTYLTTHKGLAFTCQSRTPLEFGKNVELIAAGSIWIPG
ncbi:MAG: hypothetical protein U0794_08065 [Isosphaeraceae bacterium]